MFRASLLATTIVLLIGHAQIALAQYDMDYLDVGLDQPVVNFAATHGDSSIPTTTEQAPSYVPAPFEIQNPMPMGFDPMPVADPIDPRDYKLVPTGNEGEYIAVKKYDSTVKFTLDGFYFTRIGGSADVPVLRSSPGGATALTGGDLDIEYELGGKAELIFMAEDQEIAPRFSILWTGDVSTKGQAIGANDGPADISFFNARAAEPANGYNARQTSDFVFADIGLRKTISPAYGISLSLAMGRIDEDLNLLEQEDPDNEGGNGVPNNEEETPGFFSQVENSFYGLQIGMDGQIWSNGYLKLDGGVTAGMFYNDIQVGAQALNANQLWDSSETAFIGTWNLSLVLPADPVNFRIGYQGMVLDGMALSSAQSRDRELISGAINDEPTERVFYHGLLFGIEYYR